MNKKPEITIQYFVDRGRRRTVTLSLHRLHVVLVSVLVLMVWAGLATGFLVYHAFTGNSPFVRTAGERPAGRAAIVSVGPDQPQRPKMTTAVKAAVAKETGAAEAKLPEVTLSAKAEAPAATASTPTGAMPVDTPMSLAHKEALLTDLSSYETALKETQADPTLKFSNVRISRKDDHLRVIADIEKLTGLYVEGHAFIAAEYVDAEGKVVFLSSHGPTDWAGATDPAALTKATYFKARMRTNKRFDLVNKSYSGAQLKTLRLVARDKVTGQIIVEQITPTVQGL